MLIIVYSIYKIYYIQSYITYWRVQRQVTTMVVTERDATRPLSSCVELRIEIHFTVSLFMGCVWCRSSLSCGRGDETKKVCFIDLFIYFTAICIESLGAWGSSGKDFRLEPRLKEVTGEIRSTLFLIQHLVLDI